MQKLIGLGLIVVLLVSVPARAGTVAYWRFEDGVAGDPLPKPFGAVDYSGNGNHLDPWTQGDWAGFAYRADTSPATIPLTGEANTLSVKNTGGYPGMASDSAVTMPTGVDIETMTPAAWTVEASFKPEATGWHRTIAGRDSYGAATVNPALSALYFKIMPNDAVSVAFGDVSGYWHEATSAEGLINGFDFPTNPDGVGVAWYHMAAVSDGSSLSLYLRDTSQGTGMKLVAQTDLTLSGSPDTAMTAGAGSGSDWHAGSWTVGRGMYDARHEDRAYGFIDEVRISDSALDVSEFLFVPEPGTLFLLGLGGLAMRRRRK